MEWMMSALLLGFGGSLHCAGMCGPLVLLVGAKSRWHLVQYHLARLVGYAVVGGLFGLFGKQLHALLGRQMMGVVLLLLAGVLAVSLFVNFHRLPGVSTVQAWFHRLQSVVLGWPTRYRALGVGLATVFLPCGLLYMAFGLAMTSPNWLTGAGSMLVFGIASSPALLVGQELVRSQLSKISPVNQRRLQVVLSLVALFFLAKMGWKAMTVPADMAMHHHH